MSAAAKVRFIKMHGCGNDFVLLDRPAISDDRLSDVARKLCDRHFGIGADGLLIVGDSQSADCRMRIFNADGSEAQMCGNGIRCVGKFIYESGYIDHLDPTVETMAGIKTLHLNLESGKVSSVTVDMGEASISSDEYPVILDTDAGIFEVTPVSIGNPHGVVFFNNIDNIDISVVGPALECHRYWTDRANIEFIRIISDNEIEQRTWERGVGETLACGTGACASAFAAHALGLASMPISVSLKGGELKMDFDNSTGHIMMTGNATTVFAGDIEIISPK